MKLRLALLALVVVAASVLAFGHRPTSRLRQPTRPTQTFQLSPASNQNPPRLYFVATLPNGDKGLRVQENGKSAQDVVFTPLRKGAGTALVLVLDVSSDVRPFETAAQTAARNLLTTQVVAKVAVIAFDGQVQAVQTLTGSSAQAEAAIAQPFQTHNGSRLYDALQAAGRALAGNNITSGSIVVVTNGADTRSKTDLAIVSAQMKKRHIRVFAIGLTNQGASLVGLQQLVTSSGGRFLSVSRPQQLVEAYTQLGSFFHSDYLVSFVSRVKPGRISRVSIASATESATSEQVMPTYRDTAKLPSTIWTVLAALFGAAAIFLLSLYFLDRRPRAITRLISFIPGAASMATEQEKPRFELSKTRYLQRIKWWRSLESDLDLARIALPRPTAVVIIAACWLMVCLLVALFIPIGGLVLLCAPIGLRFYTKYRLNKRRAAFTAQLPEALQALAAGMRAGHSLGEAMRISSMDNEGVVVEEFSRIMADERLGGTLEDAISDSATRMASRDLEQVAIVASLHRQTGGNMAEIFDRVVDTLRERNEIRLELKTLTAQGRLAKIIITAMPFALGGLIMFLNPGYLNPLFFTATGRILIVVALLMIVGGYYAIQKIMEIEV